MYLYTVRVYLNIYPYTLHLLCSRALWREKQSVLAEMYGTVAYTHMPCASMQTQTDRDIDTDTHTHFYYDTHAHTHTRHVLRCIHRHTILL